MKTLLDQSRCDEVKTRLAQLSSTSTAQWGRMNPAQAMAHCAVGLEMAIGESKPPRVFMGYVLGPLVRGLALKDDKPMHKNSPTAPSLRITDDRELATERARLAGLLDRFRAGGRAMCTDHPHPFFGRLTPDQWGVLMYKHLDHHLRQFGV